MPNDARDELAAVIAEAIVGPISSHRICYSGVIDTREVAARLRTWATSDAVIERVARAIATDAGWNWDDLPFGQGDWTMQQHGRNGVEYTAMHQCDYLDAARAAATAMLGGGGDE